MKLLLQTIINSSTSWLLHNQYLKRTYCFFLVLFTSYFSFGFIQSNENNDTKIYLQEIANAGCKEIALDTGWEFYWNELIAPGNFTTNKSFKKISLINWTELDLSETEKTPSFGYATYRLKFSVPSDRPHTSIFIPAAYAASKLWINGAFISEIGRVGKSQAETTHRRYTQIIPLRSDETNFEIVIQVANFYHNKGGIDKPLILGTSKHLQNVKSKRIIADMIFIGSLSFIGIFFLLFFLFYWNKDRAVLYFGIMCISLAYMALSDRYAPFGQLFESISWILLTKIEYISLFVAGAAASLFFNTIFLNFTNTIYAKCIKLGFYILALLAIFLPRPYFTQLLTPFFVLMILNLTYVFYVIIKAITTGERKKSILLLVSMIMGTLVFSTHIFFFLGENVNAIVYVNFGYIITFLLLSMLVMMRFSNSFIELEKTKEFALKQKKEISIQSSELSKMNLELKDNLRHLEKSNAELDSFNHIVSHDLKAPLVAMHTLVSFLEEDIDITKDEDVETHFKLLKDRISKMYALINGLLEYSKITKGEKKKEVFSLNELLKELIDVVDNQNEHTIHIPTEDLDIYTNKIELQHVFQNLISNAIKHNDKESALIHISSSKLANEYVFSVRDNGPGIDEKYHTKIFEMFSQLNLNEEVESTGIGLAIVKKIIAENHGDISVTSEKELGTTIKFTWRV